MSLDVSIGQAAAARRRMSIDSGWNVDALVSVPSGAAGRRWSMVSGWRGAPLFWAPRGGAAGGGLSRERGARGPPPPPAGSDAGVVRGHARAARRGLSVDGGWNGDRVFLPPVPLA